MVSIANRVRHLKELVNIRTGPGAALLPNNVTKIHMTFAVRSAGGHVGARRFWRNMLPRLKYYNPGVKMIVSRPNEAGGECMMRVYVKRGTSTTTSQQSQSQSQSEVAKVPFRPVEYNEHYVSEASSPLPPPNKSFDEDVIEISMKKKEDINIWQSFIQAVPVTPVAEGLGETSTAQEVKQGRETRSDGVEEEDGKRWLEMFKREQSRVRQLEATQVADYASMKARKDLEQRELTLGVLAA